MTRRSTQGLQNRALKLRYLDTAKKVIEELQAENEKLKNDPSTLMSFTLNKDPDSDLTEAQAVELWENYFKAYPKVRAYIDKIRAFVEANGFSDK